MTTPLVCLLVTMLLPFFWFGLAAKTRREQFGVLDNRTPRAQQTKVEGLAARTHGAQLNAFEALTYFAPAVIVAHVTHVDATYASILAVTFVVLRVLHGLLYLADRPGARTAVFALGLACSVALLLPAVIAG